VTAYHDGALHDVLYLTKVVFGEIEPGGRAVPSMWSGLLALRAARHPIPELAKTRKIRFRSRDGERIRVVWAWAPRSPLVTSEAPRGRKEAQVE